MPNKKISQLSALSPVPTGGLMVIANSGVSRSATVKDVAEAIASSNTTFSGLTDTPDGISGGMFLVGNTSGTALEFSDDLHLGTGSFLDKKIGGTISGAVTMATGVKLQFANVNQFINSAGSNLAVDGGEFLKLRSESGVSIYKVGGTNSTVNFFTGLSDDDLTHKLQIKGENYVSSGSAHIFHPSIDVSGKIFQSGVELKTGLFALKTDIVSVDTGSLVGQEMTGSLVDNAKSGNLVGQEMTGSFVDIAMTGNLVGKHETGIFPTGEGTSGYFAKWTSEGVLTTGLILEDTASLHPYRDKNLGKSNKRWGRLFCKTIDAVNDGFTFIESETTSTGDNAVLRAVNSDGNYLNLGASSTGDSTLGIGSGHYFIHGTQSGKRIVIGDKQDLYFHANTGSVTASGANYIAQFLHTGHIKLNKKVTFSDAFTFPITDGSSNQFLQTDGAGNVTWASATTSTGTLVGQEMTGGFVDTSMTGGFVDTAQTGNFAVFFKDLDDTPASLGSAGEVVVVSADGTALEFSGITASSGAGVLTGNFTTALNDTPNSYAGSAGSLVAVKTGLDGLEFVSSGNFASDADVTAVQTLANTNSSNLRTTGSTLESFVNAVHDDISGAYVKKSETGAFIDNQMTGAFIDNEMTGSFASDHQITQLTGQLDHTGVLLSGMIESVSGYITEQVYSGQYADFCAEYNVGTDGSQGIIIAETNPLHSGHSQALLKPNLHLSRGCTYAFNIVSGTVFFGISTGLNKDGNIGLYDSGQAELGMAKGAGETYYFRVPQDAPSQLNYNVFTIAEPTTYGHSLGSVATTQHEGGIINTFTDTSDFATNLAASGFLTAADTGNLVGREQTGQYATDHDVSTLTSNLTATGQELLSPIVSISGGTGNFLDKTVGGDIIGDVSILSSGLLLSGDLNMHSGVSYHSTVSMGSFNTANIDWSRGNIQYIDATNNATYSFLNVRDGQTLTMYVKNTSASRIDCTFISGTASDNKVRMPMDTLGTSTHTFPKVNAKQANVYTFVRIHTGIFASYVTGYDYV